VQRAGTYGYGYGIYRHGPNPAPCPYPYPYPYFLFSLKRAARNVQVRMGMGMGMSMGPGSGGPMCHAQTSWACPHMARQRYLLPGSGYFRSAATRSQALLHARRVPTAPRPKSKAWAWSPSPHLKSSLRSRRSVKNRPSPLFSKCQIFCLMRSKQRQY
jgi:hypothetical protein